MGGRVRGVGEILYENCRVNCLFFLLGVSPDSVTGVGVSISRLSVPSLEKTLGGDQGWGWGKYGVGHGGRFAHRTVHLVEKGFV